MKPNWLPKMQDIQQQQENLRHDEHPQQWERAQAKTFTRWCNSYLAKHPSLDGSREAVVLIDDVVNDLSDGIRLVLLVEALRGAPLGRYHRCPQGVVHVVDNLNIALIEINAMVKEQNIRLQYCAEDIINKKTNMILGMIWVLICRFTLVAVTDKTTTHGKPKGDEKDTSARAVLIEWCQSRVNKYNLVVENLDDHWRDGRVFTALTHRHCPHLIPNLERVLEGNVRPEVAVADAFHVAQHHMGIPRLLDPADVVAGRVDEKSMLTCLSLYWRACQDDDVSGGVERTDVMALCPSTSTSTPTSSSTSLSTSAASSTSTSPSPSPSPPSCP
mmetsp:Transcript_14845/g.17931  ORF Transcript_14845/g.17931 Transcript_14845/m.17931 type:complete len:330 (-) Transcript_14845:289-1278(-)